MLDAVWVWPLLFVTGLAAGWVNAVTGGGGLVVLPVFLTMGVPPHLALGTNMLQSSAGTLAAAYTFVRQRQVNLREAWLGIVCTIIGAVGGVVAVQHLAPTVLKDVLPLVLAGIVIYTAYAPRVGLLDSRPTMSPGMFYPLSGVGLGFFDGCIGAGAGSLWAMAFVMGLGCNLAKATAYAKVMNVASNVAAFTLFVGYGSVWLAAGLVMAVGQVAGGVLGAHLVIHKGAGFVRPLYLLVVIALLLKLLYERFAGVG
jgi:uncharacterized membrane protein YfcA